MSTKPIRRGHFMRKHASVLGLLFCFAAIAVAGQNPPSAAGSVSRTTKAVNYRLRGEPIEVDLHGTELMANALGKAKVEGKKSSVEIDAKFEAMDDPTRFGLEYLTYVLWAVSPQGRAVSLGELVLDPGNSHVKAITNMQS